MLALLVALSAGRVAGAQALPPCPSPNPNLSGPPNFRNGCPLPAEGLNLAAPLNSPHFIGIPTINGVPFAGGGGGIGIPGGANGSLQFNKNGILGGYGIGSAFAIDGSGNFTLAPGAAAFNLGGAAGDIVGIWPNLTLAVGSAARGVGNLGNCLGGTLPNPSSLTPGCVFNAMGAPAGDLSGTSYVNPLVTGLQGFPICPGVPPTPNSALTWGGSCYTPVVQSPGINQITGAGSAGPGTGSQILTLNPGVVANANLANAPATTLKCNAGAGFATPSDCPVTGGLAFASGALQLAPNLGTSQQITIGTSCATYQNGILASYVAGVCAGSLVLTADDGLTPLTADDGTTQLTAEGGAAQTPCATNLVFKFNVATGCNMIARLMM